MRYQGFGAIMGGQVKFLKSKMKFCENTETCIATNTAVNIKCSSKITHHNEVYSN